ncbi:MAG: hypothetical protein A4E52_00785 [Pelotomaculum sp. PtaB.Bin013]|nr:MAG: hypothetical protein A4E52_00785 [Pelotomaculum sp. PtaB.Bin013]
MDITGRTYYDSIKIFCNKKNREFTYYFRVKQNKDGSYKLGYEQGCQAVLIRQCRCEPEMRTKIKECLQSYIEKNYS